MGVALLNQTKDDIQEAYRIDNITKIEKETLYVFDRVVHFMLSNFKDRLKGITFETNEFDFDETFLRSKKNMKSMYKMMELISELEFPVSDFNFGKLKLDLERWYYRMGGEGMFFEYHEKYLITPREASEFLGISNVTLNKYMKQGLEAIDTTSHHKIPKHAIALWQDPVYAIRMQMLAQEQKLKYQTPQERLKEVFDEIMELRKKYKTESISELVDKYQIIDIDTIDDPSDFRTWQDLEEEKEELLAKLIGGAEFD